METRYFNELAAAYVRGIGLRDGSIRLPAELIDPPLGNLSGDHPARIISLGEAAGLRLHRFKRTMHLRRVTRVLGVLQGIAPTEILDVGSGRGAFLWPLLDATSELPVTAIDILPHRVSDIQAVHDGGVLRLRTVLANASALPFGDASFDAVTFLETLEHIPDAAAALRQATRVARRTIIISVPSKPDDNPEHIHLFDEQTLRRLLTDAGAQRVNFEYVLNHLIAVVRVC